MAYVSKKEYRAESIRVIDTEYNYMPIGEGYSIALDSCKISKDHNSPEPASPPLGGVVLNRNIKHQDLPVKREPYHIMKDGQVIINPEY